MIGLILGLTTPRIVLTFMSTVQNRYPKERKMIDNFLPATHMQLAQ